MLIERCSCGASITADHGDKRPLAEREAVADWRANHRHDKPLPRGVAPVATIWDDLVECHSEGYAEWRASLEQADPYAAEWCVICNSRRAKHDGFCCDHRYDEQKPCDACPQADPPCPFPMGAKVRSATLGSPVGVVKSWEFYPAWGKWFVRVEDGKVDDEGEPEYALMHPWELELVPDPPAASTITCDKCDGNGVLLDEEPPPISIPTDAASTDEPPAPRRAWRNNDQLAHYRDGYKQGRIDAAREVEALFARSPLALVEDIRDKAIAAARGERSE
jgi:hypothetical protein